ncbi:MAG TPA: metalloregulator ArsR/SmtB family transcription factor [Solirubrobacteraceae bacterium]|jgi:DNA-binding transcriptional ArsR family regulator|nr:metalloregulator ArsR/SmtB family transcription factor [Solirubrobacteraceae bacterium]
MTLATDDLSIVFAALADPTRRAMLDRLRSGETRLNELAFPFEMSIQGVSRHLKVLERAGPVTRGRLAQTRPARLSSRGLQEASGWLERYREFWEASFERLDAYLEDLQPREDRP